MSPDRAGGTAAIVFAVAGLAWFGAEMTPQLIGYEDTDSADVMLAMLQAHPWVYSSSGLALLVMAGALIPAALAIATVVAGARESLTARCSAVVGCLAAAFFAFQGALRLGGGPLLYIAGLDPDWGRAGYTAMQLIGAQGAMHAAMLSLGVWTVLVAWVGYRRRTLARAVAWSAVVPGLRIPLMLTGPFVSLPGELWLAAILLLPLTIVWCGVLGVAVLARSGRRELPRSGETPDPRRNTG
jgi:hypothetical protein